MQSPQSVGLIDAGAAKVRQFGTGRFIKDPGSFEDQAACRQGFDTIAKVLVSGEFDLVVLDEINVALCCGFLDIKELLMLVKSKSRHTELVITGRYALPELIETAELVTEMKEVKHYYGNGVMARNGIEK